jgi:hypothetical protein
MQQRVLADQEAKIQSAQTNIASQQENITHQYQEISAVQNNLATAQTNLNTQAAKIQDVEFLVDNLYSKMVFENFSVSDTNHALSMHLTNDIYEVVVKLQNVPIPRSIQGTIIPGDGFNIPQSMVNPIESTKNLLFDQLHGYDLNKTSFSFQYVKDSRETNLIQNVEVRENQIFIDDKPIFINGKKVSW